MAVSATIQVSGETPDEVRAQVTDLMTRPLLVNGNGPGPTVGEEGTAVVDNLSDIARKKIDRVFKRVGTNIKKLLTTVAAYEGGYTTEQLAADMGISLVSLRSLAGNLGRTMAPINKELGDDPPIYRWNAEINKYEMPPEIRAAILDKTK